MTVQHPLTERDGTMLHLQEPDHSSQAVSTGLNHRGTTQATFTHQENGTHIWPFLPECDPCPVMVIHLTISAFFLPKCDASDFSTHIRLLLAKLRPISNFSTEIWCTCDFFCPSLTFLFPQMWLQLFLLKCDPYSTFSRQSGLSSSDLFSPEKKSVLCHFHTWKEGWHFK